MNGLLLFGKHNGFIKGKDWIKVQEIMYDQKKRRFRLPRNSKALLSGIIKCGECQNYMRPKKSSKLNRFYYNCELKEKSKRQRCNSKNLNGNEVDKSIIETIKNIIIPNKDVYAELNRFEKEIDDNNEKNNLKIKELNEIYKKNVKTIENYIKKLSQIDDREIIIEFTKEIKKLKKSNLEIQNELKNLKFLKKDDFENIDETVLNIMNNYFEIFFKLDIVKQKELIKLIIESVVLDDDKLIINLKGSI